MRNNYRQSVFEDIPQTPYAAFAQKKANSCINPRYCAIFALKMRKSGIWSDAEAVRNAARTQKSLRKPRIY